MINSLEDILKILNPEPVPEKINGSTCVYKIKSMQMSYIPEELEHCRFNCLNYNNGQCTKYRPVSEFNIRIKGMKEYYEPLNKIR